MSELEGVTAEPTETEVEAIEVDSQEDAPIEAEAESEEVVETIEQRLERLEKEAEAKQRKIDRQTAANRKTQELLELRSRELEAIQRKQIATPESQYPKEDDFSTWEEFRQAEVNYLADQKIAMREAQILEWQQKEAAQKVLAERENLRTRQEAEYIKLNPRYKEAKAEFVDFVSTLSADAEVVKFIEDQAFEGNIAHIIDYFGSNGGERLSELEDIAKMSPRKAAIAIYEIQKGLKVPERKETKPLDKPVTKIKATSKTVKPASKMSGKELLKQMGISGY
jgi:hypothetical protein